jgi:hypothetical protein
LSNTLPTTATSTVSMPPVSKLAQAAPAVKTQADIDKLFTEVQELQKKVLEKEKASTAAPTPDPIKEIDWSKISEKDVFDLSVPIPVVTHDLPQYMTVFLNDSSLVPRWVHKFGPNIGPRLASGYRFMMKADWDSRYPIPLTFDAEGHYACGDVVALVVPKSIYYPALRRNYQKTALIQGKAKVREELKKMMSPAAQEAIASGLLDPFGENLKEEVVDEKDMEVRAAKNKEFATI